MIAPPEIIFLQEKLEALRKRIINIVGLREEIMTPNSYKMFAFLLDSANLLLQYLQSVDIPDNIKSQLISKIQEIIEDVHNIALEYGYDKAVRILAAALHNYILALQIAIDDNNKEMEKEYYKRLYSKIDTMLHMVGVRKKGKKESMPLK